MRECKEYDLGDRKAKVLLLWCNDACDRSVPGMHTIKGRFEHYAGRPYPEKWDEEWDWGDAFGHRSGSFLYVGACDGDYLYIIVKDPKNPGEVR